VLHLTHTGYYAGVPFCGCDKETRRAEGDTFAHVPYSHLDQFFARGDICPACRKVWDDAGTEADAEPAKRWILRQLAEVDGEILYWSNIDGWGHRDTATEFPERTQYSPLGGVWEEVKP
jgi:hypothetical protein